MTKISFFAGSVFTVPVLSGSPQTSSPSSRPSPSASMPLATHCARLGAAATAITAANAKLANDVVFISALLLSHDPDGIGADYRRAAEGLAFKERPRVAGRQLERLRVHLHHEVQPSVAVDILE